MLLPTISPNPIHTQVQLPSSAPNPIQDFLVMADAVTNDPNLRPDPKADGSGPVGCPVAWRAPHPRSSLSTDEEMDPN